MDDSSSDEEFSPMGVSSISSLLVVAIDFGTTYSGYAYSFRSDYKENPLKVSAQNFLVENDQFVKVPTSILFTPGAVFDSFVKEAEEKYARMCDDSPREARSWFYFERFKMSLFKNSTLSRDTVLLDHTQKKGIPAADVFSASIDYIRRHVMETMEERDTTVTLYDIKWVLTVPAIWDDTSRQFMRESAQKAGIPEEQLVLALEPEAASVFCLEHYRSTQSLSQPFHIASPGRTFMLVDSGGGTVDISVFEVKDKSSLKQLHKPVGAPAGGTKVDEAFKKLLLDIVGFDGVAAFDAMEMLELRQAFEVAKRQRVTSGKVAIRIPESIKLQMDVKIRENLKYAGKISLVRSNLMLEKALFESLFNECSVGIVEAIRSVFRSSRVRKVDAILLAGGLSESDVIQDAVKVAFPRDLVLVAPSPSAAVLSGAVMYGQNPEVIATRVSAYTYGVDTRSRFRRGVHDEARLVIDEDGKRRCEDCFDVHITIDQEVEVNTVLPYQTYSPSTSDQTSALFDIYRSTKREPLYVDEEGSEKIGSVTVLMPDTTGGMKRKIKAAMMVGGTELKFFAKDETSGQEFSTKCDFLSRD